MYDSGELNHSVLLLQFGSIDKGIPLVQIELLRLHQPHVAEDARTGIPTAVAPCIHHFHGNGVRGAGSIQIGGDVYLIRSIAVSIEVSLFAIYPEFGLIVHSFEIKDNAFAGIVSGEGEFFPVPAFTAHGLPGVDVSFAHAREGTDGDSFFLKG